MGRIACSLGWSSKGLYFALSFYCDPCDLSAIPVTFTTPLTDQTVPEGDKAIFKCETNKPGLKVQWFKNGKKITPSDRMKIQDDGTGHTLTIPKSELDDDAVYTAKVGDASTNGNLTVDGE